MKRVGLLMGLRRPPEWDGAVRALEGFAGVHYVTDPRREPMDAWLASAPDVSGLRYARASGVPVAVLGEDVTFPVDGIDASLRVPVTPFVRARWRRAADLPAHLIVDASSLAGDVLPSALAVASAVIVRGDRARLLEAMAWGAACVTDVPTADALGAVPGTHVVAGSGHQAEGLADELARDDSRAACLGRAARRLVERRWDTAVAGRAVRRALGIRRSPIDEALDDLSTPAEARIRARVQERVWETLSCTLGS